MAVQGPALYAYNNAVFDDEDWRGIRMLSQSIKHSDPLKVGHFGIGFKSVFHLTGCQHVLNILMYSHIHAGTKTSCFYCVLRVLHTLWFSVIFNIVD